MNGDINTLIEYLRFFSNRIVDTGLKPWGRSGKKRLIDAMQEVIQNGAYEGLQVCDRCGETYLLANLSSILVQNFLFYYQDKMDWGDLTKCKACGGFDYS